jgi:hypothetical protein
MNPVTANPSQLPSGRIHEGLMSLHQRLPEGHRRQTGHHVDQGLRYPRPRDAADSRRLAWCRTTQHSPPRKAIAHDEGSHPPGFRSGCWQRCAFRHRRISRDTRPRSGVRTTRLPMCTDGGLLRGTQPRHAPRQVRMGQRDELPHALSAGSACSAGRRRAGHIRAQRPATRSCTVQDPAGSARRSELDVHAADSQKRQPSVIAGAPVDEAAVVRAGIERGLRRHGPVGPGTSPGTGEAERITGPLQLVE